MSPTLVTAADLFAKGLEALSNDHLYLARTCFEQAAEEEATPLVRSYVGLCRAMTAGDPDAAIVLCREALGRDPRNPELYLNLGRVLVVVGRREEGISILRQGMKDCAHPAIVAELAALGVRKSPVFPRLSRNNPLNKYAGILLAKLGLR